MNADDGDASKVRQVFDAYDQRSITPVDEAPYCPRCGSALGSRTAGGRERPACLTCGFVVFRNPVPFVSVLIVDGDRFVLCRRRSATFGNGLWCLPSGYIEFDEDFLTSARREVREETGLEVEITALISVVSNFLKPNLHSFGVVLAARSTADTELVAGDDDVDAVAWFSIDEGLPELAFEADGHIIERYFATRLAGAPVDDRFAGA